MIPFNKPFVPDASKRYAIDALESDHQQGDGPFTAEASKMVSQLVGGAHVLLTPSCTHALEMASMLGNFGPGDEVILPSYTFTSAATAITKFGATPVFVDIDPVSKCIDVNQVADAITEKTVAVSWVNYAGLTPDIDGLRNLASAKKLILVEDNAHGLGGTYKGRPLGSFGDFATQSFHATKNIQCGEGGAIVVNNPKYIDRAEIIREKGTNRKNFFKGEVKKYTWVDQGSSYLMAEVCAAILLGQLENFESIQNVRERNWTKYAVDLKNISSTISVLEHPERNVAHMFAIICESEKAKESLRETLLNFGIHTTSHYEPLDKSVAGKHFGRTISSNLNADQFSKTILRLPLWSTLMDGEIDFVIDKVMNSTLGTSS